MDKEEIATPARISKWEYLKPISNEIVQDDDIVVGLLIGANCMKALEPMKIIPSKEDGPYAYKTLLGWCIVGPIINTETERSISCHRVAVKDVTSSRLAPHHFGVEKSIKDISLEEMFKMMYSNDFNEHDATVADSITRSVDEISIEDKKFLDIVEKNTSKKDYHYVVPLSFRDDRLVMPNNRVQAFKRLMFLKRRFLKDQKFFDDYKKFMDNLLVKGYAKQSEVVLSGKTWYIPHHGVYHPSKPGKIRVVFDCSAEFQGKSINRELLSGPDLTNQIIGIMTRFREEKIAFMADIEAMYHQVLVPDDQQTFLKFLWWSTDDINYEPQDFMMCAHVFGGTSSASWSNYTLRRTAIDNKEIYGTDSATTLLRNFYVDYLLKSMRDVQSSKQLVQNVINVYNLVALISPNLCQIARKR